jgi:hypothetical protein
MSKLNILITLKFISILASIGYGIITLLQAIEGFSSFDRSADVMNIMVETWRKEPIIDIELSSNCSKENSLVYW